MCVRTAVLVPVDEYEALGMTGEVLSDDDTLAAIRRGLADLAAGEAVSLDGDVPGMLSAIARRGAGLPHPDRT